MRKGQAVAAHLVCKLAQLRLELEVMPPRHAPAVRNRRPTVKRQMRRCSTSGGLPRAWKLVPALPSQGGKRQSGDAQPGQNEQQQESWRQDRKQQEIPDVL